MKSFLFASFFLTLFIQALTLEGINLGPHDLSIGPEWYYMHRTKEGGSKQTGWLYGGRAVYERANCKGAYWAFDGYYTQGDLSGKTARGRKLISDISDYQVEGRIGYRFYCPHLRNFTFTPLVGYGYFWSDNNFKDPSPIVCEFRNRFHYGLLGFSSTICLRESLRAGIQFKAKYMMEGKSKVIDDPQFNNVTLDIENKTQYEVDLPFKYFCCWKGRSVAVTISPFYRFRHYGGRENFPFDFIDTKFRLYGGRVLFHLIF